MLDFKYIKNKKTNEEWIETSLSGKPLLTTPQLNKGTAFPEVERHLFGLLGKLPPQIETLTEQTQRAYEQFQAYGNDMLQKNIYLNNLHDKNQVLFYKLISDNLAEMMPLIYTPIVGTAVKEFSRQYRQPRGLYIAYPDANKINEILDNRSNPEIDLIVVTDGEGVLGIGDQGVGGMDISIAKLMVYTLCGNINPLNTLPIQLDVGTNNQKLLEDPFYLGWRHKRIAGSAYEDFVGNFLTAVQKKFPHAFLHWEDLGRDNSRKVLELSRKKMCSFNDDIQGTGAVTLAAILSALKVTHTKLEAQRIVIFGAGSAGTGIADHLIAAMCHHGIPLKEAHEKLWLVDRQGLLLENTKGLTSAQKLHVRKLSEVSSWPKAADKTISLLEIIKNLKPTILIGCSGQGKAFTKEMLECMAKTAKRPIIFPLSNPTDNCEAHPEDILHWTNGQALIATGSPFDDVLWQGNKIPIAQCNNAFIFPGIGLGVLASRAKHLTEAMVMIASKALSECTLKTNQSSHTPLLPRISDAQHVARHIAIAVAKQAEIENVAQRKSHLTIEQSVDELIWTPHYCEFRKV